MIHPFDLFRWMLGTVVTIYATIVTAQFLWGWWVWLHQPERHMSLLRRYLVVHGLRLRIGRFGGDLLMCALLTVAFLLLLWAHYVVMQTPRGQAVT